jgi:bacteriocin-like protein
MTNASKFSRDHMTASTTEGKIELTEQELNHVTGGAVDTFRTYTIGSATGGAGAGKAKFN